MTSLTITQLLTLKSNLNKYAQVDNFEDFEFPLVDTMWSTYVNKLEENDGVDIAFPNFKLKF